MLLTHKCVVRLSTEEKKPIRFYGIGHFIKIIQKSVVRILYCFVCGFSSKYLYVNKLEGFYLKISISKQNLLFCFGNTQLRIYQS
jgi:hypothetical protein